MEKISDILSNCEMVPSDGVWTKLSARMDAVMPSATATQSSMASTVAHTGLSLGTKIAAAVVGLVSVAALVTVVAVATKNRQNQSAPKENSAVQENVTYAVDSVDDEETVFIQDNKLSDAPISQTESRLSNEKISKGETIEKQDIIAPSISSQADVFTHSTSSHTVTPATINPNSRASLPKSVPSAATPRRMATAVQQDPVVQNMPEESIDWSEPVKLEIPNVFTPNGDGYNDRFEIKGLESCSKRQLMVFNKYGKLVYKSNSYENNWDGSDCPDGSYAYKLIYNSGGVDQTIAGSLYIIRK